MKWCTFSEQFLFLFAVFLELLELYEQASELALLLCNPNVLLTSDCNTE